MEKYIGVKIINAEPMTLDKYNSQVGVSEIFPVTKGNDGYKVIYPDGYESWSPKDVFEEAYSQSDGMNCFLACEAAKKGRKVARKGWNASGMWVEAQFPDANSKMTFPYLFINVPECKEGMRRIPWQPAQVDLFRDDWYILE